MSVWLLVLLIWLLPAIVVGAILFWLATKARFVRTETGKSDDQDSRGAKPANQL